MFKGKFFEGKNYLLNMRTTSGEYLTHSFKLQSTDNPSESFHNLRRTRLRSASFSSNNKNALLFGFLPIQQTKENHKFKMNNPNLLKNLTHQFLHYVVIVQILLEQIRQLHKQKVRQSHQHRLLFLIIKIPRQNFRENLFQIFRFLNLKFLVQKFIEQSNNEITSLTNNLILRQLNKINMITNLINHSRRVSLSGQSGPFVKNLIKQGRQILERAMLGEASIGRQFSNKQRHGVPHFFQSDGARVDSVGLLFVEHCVDRVVLRVVAHFQVDLVALGVAAVAARCALLA